MKYIRTRIKAFSLLEFSITMVISTTIVGLMLFSLSNLGKWNHDNNKLRQFRDQQNDFITLIRQDLFRYPHFEFDSLDVILKDQSNIVHYSFYDEYSIRKSIGVSDTFYLEVIKLDTNSLLTTDISGFTLEMSIVSEIKDTIILQFPVTVATNNLIH